MTTRTDVIAFVLNTASQEDISDLISAIKMRRQQLTKVVVRAVIKGDVVSFKSRGSNELSGIVDRLGSKNVYVRVKNATGFGPDTVWRVPASMIKIAE